MLKLVDLSARFYYVHVLLNNIYLHIPFEEIKNNFSILTPSDRKSARGMFIRIPNHLLKSYKKDFETTINTMSFCFSKLSKVLIIFTCTTTR